jgi:hypothetical protein
MVSSAATVMLSAEQNATLTRVGRGTPMGELCGVTGSPGDGLEGRRTQLSYTCTRR